MLYLCYNNKYKYFMKLFLLLFFLLPLTFINANAQSPEFSFNINIEQKSRACGPFFVVINIIDLGIEQRNVPKKNTYDNDSTTYDWNSLPAGSLDTVNFDKGFHSDFEYLFQYSNQKMLFNKVVRIDIIKDSPIETDTMTIAFPVTQKAFITKFNLINLPYIHGYFEPGAFIEYNYINEKEAIATINNFNWKYDSSKERKLFLK